MKTETVIYKEHEKKQNDTVVLERKETTGFGDEKVISDLGKNKSREMGWEARLQCVEQHTSGKEVMTAGINIISMFGCAGKK